MQIRTRDEQTLDIDLFYGDGVVGAFAINRKYYRGGNSEKLLAAIQQAHQQAHRAWQP